MEGDELRARQRVAFVRRHHHGEIQGRAGSDLPVGIRGNEAKQGD